MRYNKGLFARYTRRFVGVVACYLAVAAITTTLVDPWRVLRLPWALESLEDYRDFSDAHRTGKAGLAMDPRGWDAAYIGSSRFEMGLSAGHPALAGKRVVNLALAGGLIPENTAMARFAMRRNPGLKTLLVGVDSGDLTSRVDLTGQTDFSRSPLAEGQSPVESRLRYLLGVRAFGESCKTIASYLRGKQSKYTPQGQRVGGLGGYPPVRGYVEAAAETYRAQARAFDSSEQSRFNTRKESLLEDFLTEARAAGVEVILVMTPRHALMQVHPASDEPAEAPWERERRALAAMCERINGLSLKGPPVRFLDFCTFSPLNTQALPPDNAEFPEWPDLEHCTTSTGDQLLERCFGSSGSAAADDWGTDVLATGIETHLENLKSGHRRYCRERPQDVAWIREVLFGGG
jgi:hypothetical protein